MHSYEVMPNFFYPTDYHFFYRQQNFVTQLTEEFRRQHSDVINELALNGMDNRLITYILQTVIHFTITNAHYYSGSLGMRTNQLYELLLQREQWFSYLFRAYRFSINQMKRITRTIIKFTLQQIRPIYY
ncbi:hypothetical protein [Calidifontibacillus erzurumensis]|uniref:hypothetical protein n=1 Tax=Calidifontibacillus erzurumensis TaxID=2741433 RepID=UPI0035B528B2